MYTFPPGLKRAATMIILRSEGQMLLLKRAKDPNKGLYVPVGGKVEPYEDPLATAQRECYEETGIRPKKMRYAGSLVETSPVNYNWWCNIYVADIPWQPAPLCDEGELAWFPLDQLDTIPTPPTDLAIYRYVAAGKPFAMRAIFDENLRMLTLVEDIEGVDLLNG